MNRSEWRETFTKREHWLAGLAATVLVQAIPSERAESEGLACIARDIARAARLSQMTAGHPMARFVRDSILLLSSCLGCDGGIDCQKAPQAAKVLDAMDD